MRTEREPNRYEFLNEMHRRVAEEEEKREAELRDDHGRYQPLHDTQRHVAEEQDRHRADARDEPQVERPVLEPSTLQSGQEHAENSPEVRLAARTAELEELVARGRISQSEMVYRLAQFDNELRVELETGRPVRPIQRGRSDDDQAEPNAEPEHAAPEMPERLESARDEADRIPERRSEHVPETRIEREREAAEYEIAGRGEKNDARARRMERLRSIDRDIERESHENESKGPPDLDHDSGDRSG